MDDGDCWYNASMAADTSKTHEEVEDIEDIEDVEETSPMAKGPARQPEAPDGAQDLPVAGEGPLAIITEEEPDLPAAAAEER